MCPRGSSKPKLALAERRARIIGVVRRENERLARMQQGAALFQTGTPLREAAASIGVSHTGLWKWLRRHDYDTSRRGRPPVVIDENARRMAQRHAEGTSLATLATEYGVTLGTVRRAIRRIGKLTRSPIEGRHNRRKILDALYRPEILRLYHQGAPMKAIAKELHTHNRRIIRIIREERDAKKAAGPS